MQLKSFRMDKQPHTASMSQSRFTVKSHDTNGLRRLQQGARGFGDWEPESVRICMDAEALLHLGWACIGVRITEIRQSKIRHNISQN